MSEVVIATTTLASYDKDFKRVRADCALKMVQQAVQHHYTVVAIDGGSPPAYIEQLEELGATVHQQIIPGMGPARRQALLEAMNTITSEDGVIVWTEPEKYPLIPLLDEGIAKVAEQHYDLVMLRRLSLRSYPPEQAMAYKLVALAVKYLTGIESDFGWGPTVLSKRAIPYYLNYQGEYGDQWDGIHCPKLRIIHDGLPWTIVDVDYHHPPEQTAAETGMVLFGKRIKQIDNLVSAIQLEVERLNMKL